MLNKFRKFVEIKKEVNSYLTYVFGSLFSEEYFNSYEIELYFLNKQWYIDKNKLILHMDDEGDELDEWDDYEIVKHKNDYIMKECDGYIIILADYCIEESKRYLIFLNKTNKLK